MNKREIKIFKRSAKQVAAETNNEPKVFDSSLKAARLVKREIADTIAGWVVEQRELKRYAEIRCQRLASSGI